ncbi:MAG: Fur family transcriptional regulator [Synechococcales bacterium]|nr:Fur family transcriptional regulator [Synechococcales bacterium]
MKATRTRSQDQILETLQQIDRPLSAQDLYLELRKQDKGMGLATVYRALDKLKREGAVQVRTLATGESLYSLIQEDRHHLTCLQCGNCIELDSCPLHDLEQAFSHQYQFKINYHILEFFGLCQQCQPTG